MTRGRPATDPPIDRSSGPFSHCYQPRSGIYKIALSGEPTLLYTFTDGSNCFGVTADAAGDVYGMTLDGPAPQGQVFRVSNTGEFTSLYVFSGGSDGGTPNPELTLDKLGNVYGVTSYGGVGGGVIYRISPNGTETVLHEFVAETGAEPIDDGVVLDSEGNLYGTATNNGPNNGGVIYKLSATGEYSVLHAFSGPDGGDPEDSPVLDAAGNLYGQTIYGGSPACVTDSPFKTGCGVVFELSSAGVYTIVHTFMGGPFDGANPASRVVLDSHGNLYGATSYGGALGYGVVYRLASIPAPGLP